MLRTLTHFLSSNFSLCAGWLALPPACPPPPPRPRASTRATPASTSRPSARRSGRRPRTATSSTSATRSRPGSRSASARTWPPPSPTGWCCAISPTTCRHALSPAYTCHRPPWYVVIFNILIIIVTSCKLSFQISNLLNGFQPKLTGAKCRRNVDNFLSACRKIGVREVCTDS